MYDLLFKNAIVIDGTNQPAFAADVAIESGLIQVVDRSCSLQPDHAHQVVDAQDRLLTPGFVDIHTHYDGQAHPLVDFCAPDGFEAAANSCECVEAASTAKHTYCRACADRVPTE